MRLPLSRQHFTVFVLELGLYVCQPNFILVLICVNLFHGFPSVLSGHSMCLSFLCLNCMLSSQEEFSIVCFIVYFGSDTKNIFSTLGSFHFFFGTGAWITRAAARWTTSWRWRATAAWRTWTGARIFTFLCRCPFFGRIFALGGFLFLVFRWASAWRGTTARLRFLAIGWFRRWLWCYFLHLRFFLFFLWCTTWWRTTRRFTGCGGGCLFLILLLGRFRRFWWGWWWFRTSISDLVGRCWRLWLIGPRLSFVIRTATIRWAVFSHWLAIHFAWFLFFLFFCAGLRGFFVRTFNFTILFCLPFPYFLLLVLQIDNILNSVPVGFFTRWYTFTNCSVRQDYTNLGSYFCHFCFPFFCNLLHKWL